MRVITVSPKMSQADFAALSQLWAEAESAAVQIEVRNDPADLRNLFEELLSRLPDGLALAALSTLAEYERAPTDLLMDLFLAGDKGCRTAICLRSDLTPELRASCASCSDPDVQEHYLQAQSLRKQ